MIKKNTTLLKRFNYVFGFITFFWFVFGAVYLYDTYQDRKIIFTPKAPMDLYQTSELNLNEKIGTINPSDHIKVLRVLFVREQFAIEVSTPYGPGWVLKPDDLNLK